MPGAMAALTIATIILAAAILILGLRMKWEDRRRRARQDASLSASLESAHIEFQEAVLERAQLDAAVDEDAKLSESLDWLRTDAANDYYHQRDILNGRIDLLVHEMVRLREERNLIEHRPRGWLRRPFDRDRTPSASTGGTAALDQVILRGLARLDRASVFVPTSLREAILETSADRLYHEGVTPERAKRAATRLAAAMAFAGVREWAFRILPGAIGGAGAGVGVAHGLSEILGTTFHPLLTATLMILAGALGGWAGVRELLRAPQR